MNYRVRLTLLLFIAILAGAIPAAGQDDSAETSSLLTMLGMIPDTDQVQTGNGWATVSYADYQALYVAEGIELLRMTGGTELLLSTTRLLGMSARITAGPQSLQYVFAGWQEMRDVVGFEWIKDVDRGLDYGAQPNTGTILGGNFDVDAMDTALSARGFEQTDVSGIPVWHRGADAEISVENRELADPFGGHLGLAARIAIWPGFVANSRYWNIIEDLIATTQGTLPSLADNANYRALTEAITAPEGLLLQAMFFNMADVGILPDNPVLMPDQTPEDITAGYGPLMPYALAVLADRQEGKDQVHLIGLVYPNVEIANAAAAEVAERLLTFASPSRPGVVSVEKFGAAVTSRVYTSETTGKAVALIEVRYPLPDERVDPDGLFIPGGIIYRHWADALMGRAFYLLITKAE